MPCVNKQLNFFKASTYGTFKKYEIYLQILTFQKTYFIGDNANILHATVYTLLVQKPPVTDTSQKELINNPANVFSAEADLWISSYLMYLQ